VFIIVNISVFFLTHHACVGIQTKVCVYVCMCCAGVCVFALHQKLKYGHHKSVVSFYSAISVKDYQDTTLFRFLSKTPQSVVSIVWCPPSLAPPHLEFRYHHHHCCCLRTEVSSQRINLQHDWTILTFSMTSSSPVARESHP
jgi:hypothetical protein